MSGANMERVLRLMSEKGASDVYLSSSSPILIKINGQLLQLSDQPLTSVQPRQLLAELLTPSQLEELDDTGELNVSVGMPGVGSFRLSAFKQRGSVVVSGNLPSADGKYSLYCAVIVKRVDAQTRAKTSINDLLRA